MPELPDVEVFRRHLVDTSLHREVSLVRLLDETVLRGLGPQRLGRALKGRRLETTRRHGKHLFVRLSGPGWLVLHFGMTGYLEAGAQERPEPEHTRVVLCFADGGRLAYVDQRKLGRVTLAPDVDEYVDADDLGPDALALSLSDLRDRLSSRRGSVKSALMDQSLVAGIGNIYSDEILFHARVNPKGAAASLDARSYRRLHHQVSRVLLRAAERGADPGRLPRSWLLRHREDGARCPRGNGTVRKFRAGGRGAFYCPACQP